MGVIADMKARSTATTTLQTVASAATLAVPDAGNTWLVSGSTTVTSLSAGGRLAGSRITFIGATSASVAFTNTNDPTTAGQMDLGGSNITLADQDILTLVLMNNGTWNRIANTNN